MRGSLFQPGLSDIDLREPLERGHPLAQGLAALWVPVPGLDRGPLVYDLAGRGSHGTREASASWSVGPLGPELNATGSTSQAFATSTARGLPATTLAPFTVAYVHRTRSYVALSSPFGFGTDPLIDGFPNGGKRAFLQFGGGGNYYWWAEDGDWNTGIAYDIDNRPHLACVTFDGTSVRFYRDGVLRAGPVTTGVNAYTAPGTFLWANSRNPGGNCPNAALVWGGVWDRPLSANEAGGLWDQSLAQFPDLLRRTRPWSFGVTAGGGPATYTGTGALASQPATLSATATFTAPVYTGTASLSSQPAVLAASATHAAPTYTGTGALASQPATLSASGTVTNPTYTGTATLASQPAALAATALFATAVYQGTAALASQPATLAATATFTPGANTGTGTLASQPAVVNGSATFAAPVYTGTGALASQPAVLAASAIFATAVFQGAGTLASQPAVLSGSATFTAGAVVTVYPGGTFRRALATWSRTAARALPTWSRTWRYTDMPVPTLGTELVAAVSDDREYAADLSRCPEVSAGATISSAVIAGDPGLTYGSVSVLAAPFDGIPAGKGVSARISGGVSGTTYDFAWRVTLSTGRVVVVPAKMVKVSDYD